MYYIFLLFLREVFEVKNEDGFSFVINRCVCNYSFGNIK